MSRMKYEKLTLYVAINVASITKDKKHERFNINLAWFNEKHVMIFKEQHDVVSCVVQRIATSLEGSLMSFICFVVFMLSATVEINSIPSSRKDKKRFQ